MTWSSGSRNPRVTQFAHIRKGIPDGICHKSIGDKEICPTLRQTDYGAFDLLVVWVCTPHTSESQPASLDS